MALVPVAEGTGELPRELDEALAQLSHEERQLLEKYLPSRAASQAAESLKITVGIEMEMISGHLCQKIRAQYRNLTGILWVTDQLPIGPEEYAFYTELAKRTLHREGMEDWYLWAEVLSRTGGFAMKQENALQSAAGTIKTIVVVENIVEKSVPGIRFPVTSGFPCRGGMRLSVSFQTLRFTSISCNQSIALSPLKTHGTPSKITGMRWRGGKAGHSTARSSR